MTTLTVRPGCVVYVDLAWHDDVSKEEFWSNSGLKQMRVFGLVADFGDVVKVLVEDDLDHNNECEGIVIPRGCIDEIIYFEESESRPNARHLDASNDHN